MATILIVDDDAVIRGLLVELLAGEVGLKIVEASSGPEALRMAAIHHPKLVISDVLMPTMDGFELVRLLRSSASLEHTAVIFYTGTFLQKEALDLAKACGAIYVE